MKKIILIVSLVLMLSTSICGQPNKNDVSTTSAGNIIVEEEGTKGRSA